MYLFDTEYVLAMKQYCMPKTVSALLVSLFLNEPYGHILVQRNEPVKRITASYSVPV